jgi:hypothetical protein
VQFGRWLSVLITKKLSYPSTTLKNEDSRFIDMVVTIHQTSRRQFVTFTHRCASLELYTKIKCCEKQTRQCVCCKNVRIILYCLAFRIKLINGRDLATDLLCPIFIFKGKAVPLQAWSGPEGSRKLRFPDFMTTAKDDGKVVSLTHRLPLPPGNTPGTHFCWRLSRP